MTPDWVAVDWGTSSLRLWAIKDGEAVDERRSDQGMGRLTPDGFEPTLLAQLGDWLPDSGRLNVLICGMAGAKQGWHEAPYRGVPCPPSGLGVRADARDPRLKVRILPGLCQMDPLDVMRGEETQIAGLLALNPGFDGQVCLPGTHSKWARVAGGLVQEFTTFMTGELFDVLAKHSILRLSMGEGWDAPAFLRAVTEACDAPLSTQLFRLRAGALLSGLSPDSARARLSGLLIGSELSAVEATGPVAVIGDNRLVGLYSEAMRALGRRPMVYSGRELALSGLIRAYDTALEDHL